MGNDTSHERIGEFLIKIGAMTPEQRNKIPYIREKEPDRLFRAIEVELGYINDAAIDRFLSRE